ncbi:MAG TPA: RNA polymerase sigma factor [Chthonomonadaceae bacterium]|nr:RNA polymerase sigma factor [Chthonomonadaceae bacterium]
MTAAPVAGFSRPEATSRLAADRDRAYVEQARAGDQTAFAPLWERYWRNLFAYFCRQIGDREEAEDLASETLLAAFAQMPAFRGQNASPERPASGATFSTYLGAIARHKLARYRWRRAHRPYCGFADMLPGQAQSGEAAALEERCGADVEADPLRALLRQEHLDEVCYALVDVGLRSSESFKALLLHYLCGLPHKEIARLLDTRPETVNTRLQEGRRALLRHYRRPQSGEGASGRRRA